MKTYTLKEKLRYQFDNTMSKGPIALIGWLGIVSVVMIFIISLIVVITGIAPEQEDGAAIGLIQMMWMGLMRTLDAGTMGGDEGNWSFLFAMLAITMGGIFIVSTLIGVLTSGIESKIEELRKGRSFVIEKNHTVILGWSEQIFSIIPELVEANTNQKRPSIVILSEKDKVEMEDEIRSKITDTKNTRIVCRSGSPIDMADIQIVTPQEAKSIIILGPEASDPDSHVIKTILAITNGSERKNEPYHIVAEIRDNKNMAVAKMVAKNEAKLVLVSELISRIMVQTCRQSGLSIVYTELLDFGGDEIYFKEEASLVGKTFGESLLCYEDSSLIGLRFADGRIQVNPPMDTKIQTGDKIIAISEDDDTIQLSKNTNWNINTTLIRQTSAQPKKPESTLILGWNASGINVIKELDHYVAKGSRVFIVASDDDSSKEITGQQSQFKNQSVEFQFADTTNRDVLESLNVSQYDHIITLSYSEKMDVQEADAKTLITLLHLRDMAEKSGKRIPVVSEMLDVRNRDLAKVTRADDFIVSDKLIALLLSQISENDELYDVFMDLFDPEGSEIYLKSVTEYVATGQPINFYTVLESAKQRGEVAIGYKIKALADDESQSFGVKVNPKKSAVITFTDADKIIVIAED